MKTTRSCDGRSAQGAQPRGPVDRRTVLQLVAAGSALPMTLVPIGATARNAEGSGRRGLIDAPGYRTRLRAAFLRPPQSANPDAYWYWMNEQVSREGITADIDPMLSLGRPWLPGGPGATLSPAGLLGPLSMHTAMVRKF